MNWFHRLYCKYLQEIDFWNLLIVLLAYILVSMQFVLSKRRDSSIVLSLLYIFKNLFQSKCFITALGQSPFVGHFMRFTII